MGRVIALLAVGLVAVGLVTAWARTREDDRPVDPSAPHARQAIAVAREVVPGELVDVRRDRDNGKLEVTLRQDGREYEVEIDPETMSLLRVDYD